ncbi:MAG: VOC family protein [Chloroflexota bacterium]
MNLEHVAINVPEPGKMAEWWSERFGMKIVLANTTAPFIHFISDGQGSMLELYSNPDADIPDYSEIHPQTLHIAFVTDTIEEERQRLIDEGATPVGEITPLGTNLLAFFRDPWGVPFQLVKRQSPLE